MQDFVAWMALLAAAALAWVGNRVFYEKPIIPRVWWDSTDPFNDKKPPPA